ALLVAGLAVAHAQSTSPRAASAAPPGGAPRLVMASYVYGYQADGRKAAPARLVRLAGGATALVEHPWESDGPWFSYDRSQWHRNQLQVMQSAGIDVALPLYRGDAADRAAYATRGLDVMAQALKELRSAPTVLVGRGR